MATKLAEVTGSSVRDLVSPEEWQARVDLAACYRLVAHYGWDDLIFTHITVRVPGPEEHFLINPYGLMFQQVTASNLVKIDLNGKIILPTEHFINPAGFLIHSTIHAARHDIGCVLHTHSLNGVAVSAQKQGLLPLSQQAYLALSSLAYHDYEGIALEDDERPRLVADLGTKRAMILRNHGLLTVGKTPAEAFLGMYILESACLIQVRALTAGLDQMIHIPESVLGKAAAQMGPAMVGMGAGLTWPGLLKMLDDKDPSFRS
jgi:ribulose-5-phosphate 4-epimerase/fuculose-1-phosphate aldolase